MPALKTIDGKGRLTLGREFAGQTVRVENSHDAVIVKFYRLVPAKCPSARHGYGRTRPRRAWLTVA